MLDLTAAHILADSVSPQGHRLITTEAIFPRFILAEVNTHRSLCLAGDAMLEFDLPAGRPNTPHHRHIFKMAIADFVDKWHNGAAPRRNKPRKDGSVSFNRQPIRERLQNMQIRQLDETTGLIQTSTVQDCFVSGVKRVYEVRAGKFRIAGSADHRIYTPEGWCTIGELAPGDKIIARRKGKRDEDFLDPMRLKKIGGRWRSVWQNKKRAELFDLYGGCTECGSTDDLHVHHIIPVYAEPSLAFSDDNVTLLCGDCHDVKHKTQGWQGGTYLYGDEFVVDEVVFRGHEMTYDLSISGKFENFIANGIVVHNSRNSASSRAIPVAKQIARVQESPFVPQRFPVNQPGMSADAYIEPGEPEYDALAGRWLQARTAAVRAAQSLLDADVHKQIASRLLEPFMWHTAIISATEEAWTAMLAQRCHPAAQPEFRLLALAIRKALASSTPVKHGWSDWHLPLTGFPGDGTLHIGDLIKVSIARCARVSYLTHDGQRDVDADLGLFKKLYDADPKHLSPFEHVAVPSHIPGHRANFLGWRQARQFIESGAQLPQAA